MKLSLLFVTALALAACDASTQAPDPIDPGPEEITRLDLRTAMGADDVFVVGVTVDPEGRRFVLDNANGLHEIFPDGTGTLVLERAAFPLPDQPIDSGFTDIAALGGDRFALTAINDGFVLDLRAGTLTQHFCYVPPDTPEGVSQLTQSVAFDAEAGLLHAQPQSFDGVNGLFASQVGTWDGVSGDERDWYNLADIEYLAGGMAVEATGVFLLARGATIDRFTTTDGALVPVVDLAAHGVSQIDGMAIGDNAVIVADGITDELVEIPLSVLP